MAQEFSSPILNNSNSLNVLAWMLIFFIGIIMFAMIRLFLEILRWKRRASLLRLKLEQVQQQEAQDLQDIVDEGSNLDIDSRIYRPDFHDSLRSQRTPIPTGAPFHATPSPSPIHDS